MREVLVVGSLAYDSVKTPSGTATKSLGGSANYFSVAASLFAPVRVVGVVGEDYSVTDRQILIDRGRTRKTQKRDRSDLAVGNRFSLGASSAVHENLSAALSKLGNLDPSAYRVLRLKTDHGLTWEEIAAKMQITVAQARGEYAHAIAWLREQIS